MQVEAAQSFEQTELVLQLVVHSAVQPSRRHWALWLQSTWQPLPVQVAPRSALTPWKTQPPPSQVKVHSALPRHEKSHPPPGQVYEQVELPRHSILHAPPVQAPVHDSLVSQLQPPMPHVPGKGGAASEPDELD